mgnify:CR=1 FL=1
MTDLSMKNHAELKQEERLEADEAEVDRARIASEAANAALNAAEEDWAELGMRVIEPGVALSLDMRIDVRAG